MSLPSRGRLLRVAVGLTFTVGFLWMALRRIEVDRVVSAMTQIHWYILPLAFTFLATGYTARIIRWWWMLSVSDTEIKLSTCAWPLLVGVAVNNVAPLRIGDVLRVVGFRQQLRASPTRLVATLLIERILDATVLLGFLVAGIAGLKGIDDSGVYARSASVISVGILFVWALVLLFSDRIEGLLHSACQHGIVASHGLSEVAERHIKQFFVALSIVRRPAQAIRLLGISVVIWSFEGAVFQTVAWGLSYEGRWYGPWFAFAAGTLSTLIPSSPGYVGTFDFFAMSALMGYGASRSLSAAFAFLVHAVLWFPLTVAGLAYTILRTSRIRRERIAVALSRGRDGI